MRRSPKVLGVALVIAMAAAGCAPESNDSSNNLPIGGEFAGSDGNGTPGGAGGAGDPSDPDGPGTGGSGGVPERDADGDRTCGGESHEAEARQLDVYVMFDESGSMFPWWGPVSDAVVDFVNDPRSAGIGVGIQFFGSNCEADYYAQPRVPIAPVPGNAAAIQASFPLLPLSGTATEPALEGAIAHARAQSESNPDHKVVVLLVTDGLPSNCDSTVEGSAAIAAEGFTGHPSIQTYVIGIALVGGHAMDTIAEAGGTSRSIQVGTTTDELVNAMEAIRGRALPCDYALPADADDLEKVNLDFKTDGADAVRVPKVANAGACDPDRGGWYFDDDDNPSRLLACDLTCEQFKNTSGASRVDVVLGCPTIIIH